MENAESIEEEEIEIRLDRVRHLMSSSAFKSLNRKSRKQSSSSIIQTS